VGSICGGHLNAIVASGEGAITVGAGGHALSLSRGMLAQLEAVQTTRDLLSLAVDSNGTAWAGSAQTRLLRRSRAAGNGQEAAPATAARGPHAGQPGSTGQGGEWVRMSAELGLSSSVVALWATPRMVRAICDDGAVIEGTVPDDHVDR